MLIPVDFTGTSANTISFAVEWSRAYGYNHIILLKTMYDTYFDSLIPAADYVHVSQDYMVKERKEALEQLNGLCSGLKARVDATTKVSTAFSETPLLRSILEVVEREQPELIMLGSDNMGESGNSAVANSVIEIARVSPVRVLIVPSHFRYQPVLQALVPCDFATVSTLSKLDHYQAASPQWKEKKNCWYSMWIRKKNTCIPTNTNSSEKRKKPCISTCKTFSMKCFIRTIKISSTASFNFPQNTKYS